MVSYLFLFTTNANYLISRSVISGLLNSRPKPHVEVFVVITLHQIGQKALLAITVKSCTMDICFVYEAWVQDLTVVVHLTTWSV